MASSTSKSTGRCSSGSRVRWPGRISRSSQVTSARHERAALGKSRRQLGSLQAPVARRVRPRGGVPSVPGTDAYLEMRGGRAETSMPSRRSGSTCWSTRNRLEAASRPDTTASTRRPVRRALRRTPTGCRSWSPLRVEAAPEGRLQTLAGQREPQCRQRVQSGPGVLLVVARWSVRGPCAAAGSTALARPAARPGVRSRRIGPHDHVPQHHGDG